MEFLKIVPKHLKVVVYGRVLPDFYLWVVARDDFANSNTNVI